jgi:hypothetical protein
VPGLIKPQLPAAWESNVSKHAPGRLVNFRTVNALRIKRRHHCLEIFTHQIKFVLIVFVARVTGYFSGWQRKD